MKLDKKNNRSDWLMLCISYALVMMPANVSPFLVVTFMSDLSLTADQAGFVLTTELVSLALTAAILSPFAARVAIKGTLLVGAGLALLGNTLTMQVESMDLLITYRIIAGLGAGVLLLGVNVGIARARDPIKLYGLANMTGLSIAAVLFLILPGLIERWEILGAYGSLALLVLIALLLILILPAPKQTIKKSIDLSTLSVSRIKILCLTVALLLAPATYLSFYVFSEPIGTRTGLSIQQMGVLLATIQFGGVLAASLASWFGSRRGIFIPLLGALGGQAVAIFIATQTDSSFVFITSFLIINMLFLFSMPFQLGIGAILDKTGRLASIGAGIFFFGGAGGPYLGGYLIENHGISSIGIVTCVGVIIALTCFWYVTNGMHFVVNEKIISKEHGTEA